MKLQHLHLENHPLFGPLDISFSGPDEKALDTIVIAGVNGTGKTTLLREIVEIFKYYGAPKTGWEMVLEFSNIPDIPEEQIRWTSSGNNIDELWNKKLNALDEKNRLKVVYMPTELNFEDLRVNTLSYSFPYQFVNIINQKFTSNIASFIASIINNEVYRDMTMTILTAVNKICDEINGLFDILDIDVKIVGLSPEGEKLPIFKNSAGSIFNINSLSSGEKQLFIRAMTLRMISANNSIILIDEPEISLHPSWQQKIVKVYQKMGENNQIIFATHSPHVVSSVPKECVKLLKRENGQIKIVDYNDISGSFGLPVDIVLQELMGLKTVRDPEVAAKIKDLWNLLQHHQHETEEFNTRYNALEDLLSSEDEDLLLMRIEIAKQKAQKDRRHAGDKKE